MEKNISQIHISGYSLSLLDGESSFDEITDALEELKYKINEYAEWSKIEVICMSDIVEYSSPEENEISLEYKLLSAADYDDSIYAYYLTLIEKAIGPYKSHLYTTSSLDKITNQNEYTFPRNYAFCSKNLLWPNITEEKHTDSCLDTLQRNASFIASVQTDEANFIELCIENFYNIEFHPQIVSTLNTIKRGTYLDYIFSILICLNTLNKAHNLISKDPQKNEEDLLIIAGITADFGKQFPCTRQGKNKPFFQFNNDGKIIKINCEYHLKINWNDKNIRDNNEDFLRLYFGLKYDENNKRKFIKVAHIGCHLPIKNNKI
ncbi:hypothetical protein [Pantoea sp. SGAir0175]